MLLVELSEFPLPLTARAFAQIFRAMQIDHDPKEPSHRAWIIMSGVTVILTIGALLALKFGLEQIVDLIPLPILTLMLGLLVGWAIGMRVGWWDCERYHSRTPGNDG